MERKNIQSPNPRIDVVASDFQTAPSEKSHLKAYWGRGLDPRLIKFYAIFIITMFLLITDVWFIATCFAKDQLCDAAPAWTMLMALMTYWMEAPSTQ